MATITQDMRFRLLLIQYAEKYGVTKASVKYKTNRQYIYRWKRRYDGSIGSLRGLSRGPHHHPNQHTPEKPNPFPICAGATPMLALSFSGLSPCSAAIPDPLPASTASLKSRASWLPIPRTPSMSPSLMSR